MFTDPYVCVYAAVLNHVADELYEVTEVIQSYPSVSPHHTCTEVRGGRGGGGGGSEPIPRK